MGTASKDDYITPAMARTGDEIIMTKGAAIESTAVLALSFPVRVQDALGKTARREAAKLLRSCSTVRDAQVASSVGIRSEGVSSMHDATEGGVLGGLYEMARSSRRDYEVDVEKVLVPEVCESVCRLFGLDPLTTVSEGSLLLTCSPDKSREVVSRLSSEGIAADVVGKVRGKGGRLLLGRRGKKAAYDPPREDPYWKVYAEGVANGWK